MAAMKICIALIMGLIAICYGQTGSSGRYPQKYNLIDPDPSCRYSIPSGTPFVNNVYNKPQCPGIYNGAGDVDVKAVHPNVRERTAYTMRNFARLFSTQYADSEWGYRESSGPSGWTSTSYKEDCNKPAILPTKPYYFMSEAVQAARWNAFSHATEFSGCNRKDYATWPGKPDCVVNGVTVNMRSPHYTCCTYCRYNYAQECGYIPRTAGMMQLLFTDNAKYARVGSEGVWGYNLAFYDSAPHCRLNFNYEYHHMGIGSYPAGQDYYWKWQFTTMVGVKNTEGWEDHVFPHATHFDWTNEQYTFLVQFFGGNKSPKVYAQTVYLLYQGQAIQMTKVVGSRGSGFYKVTKPLSSSCEPYAFIAEDTTGNWWRLPEDESYYFGTISDTEEVVRNTATCRENHYYKAGSQWVANGGPGLTNSASGCAGCSKVASLVSKYTQLAGSSQPLPTPQPTARPTTKTPTAGSQYSCPYAYECVWLRRVAYSYRDNQNNWMNGKYYIQGCQNGAAKYKSDAGRWMYYVNGKYRVSSATSGGTRYLQCSASSQNVLDCQHKWYYYQQNEGWQIDSSSYTTDCSGSSSAFTAEDCEDVEDLYGDALCVENAFQHNESSTWTRADGLCEEDTPVYQLADEDTNSTYYLHYEENLKYYDSDELYPQWTIDAADGELYAYCEERDLLNCTDGKWYTVTEENGNVPEVEQLMSIYECSLDTVDTMEKKTSFTGMVAVVLLALLAVLLVIAGCCVYRKFRNKVGAEHKKMKEMVPDEEEMVQSHEDEEIEVDMAVTDTTTR